MTDTSLEAGAPDAAEPDQSSQPTVDTPLPTFADFDVHPDIVAALTAINIVTPFPIQAMTLPVALGGHDIIGQAKTGTGKTLGFGVPILQRIVTPTDDGFESLGQSRSIEYIWGRRCHNLRSRGFRALARIPTLGGLSVSCLNVADEAIAALPEFPALRELMPMDIPDAGYRHIGKCERLESLVLMYCRDTGDAATEHITRLPALRKYFASYTRITDRTPELLSGMETLESVTFDKCAGLTNAGIRSLARLPRLKELGISGRRITSDVATAFGSAVTVHYSL